MSAAKDTYAVQKGIAALKRKVWTLYKAPNLDALAIGLETCELGHWQVLQIIEHAGCHVIVAFKVLAS